MGILSKNKKKKMSFNDNVKNMHKNLNFTASEQYRLLRTNIKFTLPEDIKCPIVGVSSSLRGEGKSTTAVNLAYALAKEGSKTLLIDCDLRIPTISKKTGADSTKGLTDLLLGESFDVEEWQSVHQNNTYIITSGKIPPNPSELLGSERMEKLLKRLREDFDYIVLDLPPVNLVSDAMSVSKLIDGMILVVREAYSDKKSLELCVRQIKLADIRVLGCVINDSSTMKVGYGNYGKNGQY